MVKELIKKVLDTALRFVLCVLIFWTPYSTAVIEICVILASVLWLMKRSIVFVERIKLSPRTSSTKLFLNSFRPIPTPVDKPISIFLVVTLAAVLFNPGWGNSFYAWLTKIVEWFVIFYLFAESFQTVKHIRVALYVWTVTAL